MVQKNNQTQLWRKVRQLFGKTDGWGYSFERAKKKKSTHIYIRRLDFVHPLQRQTGHMQLFKLP